jgi:hypothetical protein
LHVDYWDYLGWKDEFSSPLFSRRQEFYVQKFKLDSAYTPQMVVDGNAQFTGSNLGQAAKAITEAAKSPKAAIQISKAGDKLNIKITDLPEHDVATVFLAIAEDNLTSKVERGENKGKNLEHVSVVRELKGLSTINPPDKSFETETSVQINPGWKRENLKAIVFIQENKSRKILGAGRFSIDNN